MTRGPAAAIAGAIALASISTAPAARADPPAPPARGDRVTFSAGRLDGDARLEEVTLSDRVEVRYDRYRLYSDRLRLRLDQGALVFDGTARLALCPCPRPPFAIAASGGRVEPTGDVFLRFPRAEIAGVPVLALPWIWVRSPDRPGLLPPIVAYRGGDGLLLGAGVHLPWRGGDGAVRALDLTGAGYVLGGAEASAKLLTPDTTTRAVIDVIHGTRAVIDARGSLAPEPTLGLAWRVDAIRGDRARSGTMDLAPAAEPFDRAAAEASLRVGSGPILGHVGAGLVAAAIRGEGPIAAGPRAFASAGGAIGRVGSWSAEAAGAVLGDPGGEAAVSLARGAAGGEIDARPGPFEIRVSMRGRARVAGDAPAGPPSADAIAALRADAELPLVRVFPARLAGDAPLAHWITPAISVQGAIAAQRGAFFTGSPASPLFGALSPPLEAALAPASILAAAGASTAIGRFAGPSLRFDARAGIAADPRGAVPLLHGRLAFDARFAAGAVDAAAVPASPFATGTLTPTVGGMTDRGLAVVGRARIGRLDGVFVRLDLAAQTGDADAARAARAVAAGAWASVPGADAAWLATSGTTLGAEISVPWVTSLRTALRADADVLTPSLLAVRGLAEYRHPCGCLALGLLGAHREGRRGVDVLLSVDVVPPARLRQP